MTKSTRKQDLENITALIKEMKDNINAILNLIPNSMVFKQDKPKEIDGALYNIHKRSVPIGVDKIVVVGVTKQEAMEETNRLINREIVRRNNTNEPLFYIFDTVPVNATDAEKSVYYNPEQLIKE